MYIYYSHFELMDSSRVEGERAVVLRYFAPAQPRAQDSEGRRSSPQRFYAPTRTMDPRQGPAHESAESAQSTADLTAFVQNLLQQMQMRFQTMSDNIISKIDEMGTRIDDLEKSVGDLLKEASQDAGQVPPSQQSQSVVTGQ